jgi:hypothetical protein
MKRSVLGASLLVFGSAALYGQATSTASRRFDLQAGGGFTIVKSDYYPQAFKGGAVYATLDFTYHFGAEIDFRQADASQDPTYERTYEIGGRYHREYGRFEPYAKGLYGRGVFNFVDDTYDPVTGKMTSSKVVANLAYNEFAVGGGTDFHVLPWLNVRADYEYQIWHSFPPHGLSPQVLTFGVAYHFPGGLKKGRRFK